MRGDFTRGHQPDQKRGRNYRRVLLQQGRLLLDSDFNALVDAHDELLRDLSRDTAGRAGSPDLGYLVTPGQLLAVFDSVDGIETSSEALEIYRDYRYKILDRYPSLYLGNSTGAAVTVRVPLRDSTGGDIDLWLRSDALSQVTVEGSVLNVASTDFTRQTISPADTDTLEVTLADGQEVWLGMVERHQEAGTTPTFWAAAGSFHVDGLRVEIPQDGAYPDLHFDPAEGFQIPDLEVEDGGPRSLQAGDRVLAYLEAFERHITHVEDRGILEEALGGSDDTCTRTQAMCQVKVAAAHGMTADQLRRAVRSPLLPGGTLDVTTAAAISDPDPCALPVAGGYRGTDNRLYRFEVHLGGGLADCQFKWSRDNGSELFRVRDVTVAGPAITQLIFDAESPLESGDLVEVLDEPHELADQTFATIDDAAETFTAPERAVGRLVRLHAAAGPVDGKAFDLSDPDDDAIAVTLTDFGAPPATMPKVRRWHGLITPAGETEIEVEDGIQIELAGAFRAGDWWQYEARARRGNDNGPFQTSPHGPERLFAPLGLFEYQAEDQPLELVAWLEDRFPNLCGICADDVCFDGERVGVPECDTVQEALEKLFEREAGGCCERTLTPETTGDDADRINDLLAETVGDLTVCLRPGIYRLESVVEVEGRCLTLVGCPEAVLVAAVGDGSAPFRVANDGRLRLGKLALIAPHNQEAMPAELIELDDSGHSFEAAEVALILAGPAASQAAIRVQQAAPLSFDPADPAYTLGPASTFPITGSPSVSVVDSVVIAGWGIVADFLQDVEIRSSAFYLTEGGVSSSQIFGAKILDNLIVAGVSADLTASWTASELADEPKRMLDELAAALGPLEGLFAPPSGLVGLVAQQLGLADVERNSIVATIGAVVYRNVVSQWQDNLYRVGTFGIDCIDADNATLTRELIDLEAGLVGLQVFGGSQITVRDCHVWNAGIALRFAGDELVTLTDGGNVRFSPRSPLPGRPSYANLHEVQAVGNRCDGQIGVQLGAAGVNGSFGQVASVSLRQNLVEARTGFLLRGPVGQFVEPNQVLVDNNSLLCTLVGIELGGAGIALTSNSLNMSGPQAYIGIRALQSPRVLIMGNSISGSLGQGYGIWMQDSDRCRIQDNHVAVDEGARGLSMIYGEGARVIDNDLGFRGIDALYESDLTLQGNRTGSIVLTRCDSGTLRGNTAVTDLRSLDATGRWQIEDNRAGGRISLEPDGLVGPDAGNGGRGGRGSYVIGARAAATHRSEWIGTAINFLAAEHQGSSTEAISNRLLLGAVPGSEARAVASYAGANMDWRDDWANALIDEVDGLVIDEVAELDDGEIVINAFFENEYHAQLVGNWADSIQVGHASGLGGVVPSREAVVQVVGNRADTLLDVRPYVHAVVANNAAGSLTAWIQRQTNVNSPNIQF